MSQPMTHDELLKLIDQAAAEGWEELDLSGIGLEELPPEIGKLTGLKKLLLGKVEKSEWIGNSLTEIPAILFELTELQEIDLRKNQITVIPDAIAQLKNLTKLGLNHNQIMVIPDAIAQLKNLTSLDLGTNQISSIPDTISQLENLTYLNLGTNQFAVIPEVVMQLSSLNFLGLHNNQRIAVIPDAIAHLINLTRLYLYINQITVIPDAIAHLTNLTELYLYRNQITVIPDAIAQLTNLTELSLSGNQITVVPDAIAQLTNLTRLYLFTNQITVIPDAIAQLTNLTELSLSGNQVTDIPSSITSLSKLEKLDLRRNPLGIPKDVLDYDASTRESHRLPAAKPILDYYFTTRDPDETTHLLEAKLLIVGEGGTGKTSLAQKLLNPDYELTSEIEDISTEGIDILKWKFRGTNGKHYCINIWDFGGQEIYHQTHQFFLTDRSLYLLVADSRKEDTDHPYWLNIIRLLSDNSPVLLVQNEKQNRTCTLNLRELRAEFDQLYLPTPINLSDNRNLSDLRKTIQRHLEDLLGDGLPFPNKWLAVRHSLENDNRNHISLTDYETTCRRHGIRDKSEMLNLSRFLHSLGLCLHFQKDPILRQTFILKPNWGTAAVYKVLDCDRVKQNLGQFTTADLDNIWSSPEYAHLHPELLQLMKEFKVCYEIPRRPGHYIAPHLLTSTSPDYPWDSNTLTLRYRYQGFMPKGILTRFIVEMHRQIENVSSPQALVWRTGVVLNNGTARAEILENQTHREIQIRVSGTRPRDFLTVIHYQFETIHDSFDNNLNYETLIPCNCTRCKPSKAPYTFALDRLYTYLDQGRYQIECYESGERPQVRNLIGDVIAPDPDELESDSFRKRDRRYRSFSKRDRLTPNINITFNNTNSQDNTMTDSKTNNFNAPMSGVIGSDNAQVSNNTFNQINNATTTELLQLIAQLRETATAFPAEPQDAILIDLEDIEAEIQKPEETRNPKKLKQRLTAIVLAAGVAAGGVSQATDFANKAIDLSKKLGIELPLPGKP
ncbi:Miro domain-containing protein [Leptolyngbya sp. NIES-3755]|nr:Miro domain-containing protein [Leptolyngbya sp. NIES-3755]